MTSETPEPETLKLDHAAFYLNSIDDAIHNTPSPVSYEWWYFDASFDNNYSMASLWKLSSVKTERGIVNERLVDFSIYNPSGQKIMAKQPFDDSSVSISSEKCDVTMGNNRVYGETSLYNLSYFADGVGGNLVFKSLVQGFRAPPDGTAYFSAEPVRYMGWAIAQPRAVVTGKLFLDGREINVSGTGYHDHNWGNAAINEVYDHWYWGRIFLPRHTLIYSVGQLSEKLGGKPVCVLLSFEDDKLIDLSGTIIADPGNFKVDDITGIEYPQKLVLKANSEQVKGKIVHNLKNLVESYPLPDGYPLGQNETTTHGHGAVRFLSDCTVDLVVRGQKVQLCTPLIHEYMKP